MLVSMGFFTLIAWTAADVADVASDVRKPMVAGSAGRWS
jgi:hypothetical protein